MTRRTRHAVVILTLALLAGCSSSDDATPAAVVDDPAPPTTTLPAGFEVDGPLTDYTDEGEAIPNDGEDEREPPVTVADLDDAGALACANAEFALDAVTAEDTATAGALIDTADGHAARSAVIDSSGSGAVDQRVRATLASCQAAGYEL